MIAAVKRQRYLLFAIGLIVSGVFLWLAFRSVEFPMLIDALARTRWPYLLAIVFLLTLNFVFKALRWQLLLGGKSQAGVLELFKISVVGYAGNLFLPAQLGELVRVYLIKVRHHVPATPALVSVMLERILDFFMVVIFVAAVAILDEEPPSEMVVAGKVSAVIGVSLLLGIFVFTRFSPQIIATMNRIVAILSPKVARGIEGQLVLAADAMAGLGKPSLLVRLVGLSLLQWVAMGWCFYLGVVAVGVSVPFTAGLVVLAVTALGMTVPNSPGFFGTIQLCFVVGLVPYGVSSADALAASVAFHATLIVAVAVGGAVCVYQMGYTAKRLYRTARDAEQLA